MYSTLSSLYPWIEVSEMSMLLTIYTGRWALGFNVPNRCQFDIEGALWSWQCWESTKNKKPHRIIHANNERKSCCHFNYTLYVTFANMTKFRLGSFQSGSSMDSCWPFLKNMPSFSRRDSATISRRWVYHFCFCISHHFLPVIDRIYGWLHAYANTELGGICQSPQC